MDEQPSQLVSRGEWFRRRRQQRLALLTAVLPVVAFLSFGNSGRYVNDMLFVQPFNFLRVQSGLLPHNDTRLRVILTDDRSLKKLGRRPTFGELYSVAKLLFDRGYDKVLITGFHDLPAEIGAIGSRHTRGQLIVGAVSAASKRAYPAETLPAGLLLSGSDQEDSDRLDPALTILGPDPRLFPYIDRVGHLAIRADGTYTAALRLADDRIMPSIALWAADDLSWTDGGFVTAQGPIPLSVDGSLSIDYVDIGALLGENVVPLAAFLTDHGTVARPVARVETQLAGGKIAVIVPDAYSGSRMIDTPLGLQGAFLATVSLVNDALRGRYLHRPLPQWIAVPIGAAIVLALLSLEEIWTALGATLGFALLQCAAGWGALAYWGVIAPCAEVALAAFAGLAARLLLHLITTLSDTRRLGEAFACYLSPVVVAEVMREPEKLRTGGQRRDVTVFFCDVRDFTTISESLDPQTLTAFMNQYFTAMTDIIMTSRGLLDKYIGDAIMAFWGAPLELDAHPDVAVTAALAMLHRLDSLREEFRALGWPALRIGIGLHSGDASIGNMGSAQRFSYTAMGDSVNLASRIESLTAHYGVELMASEFTVARLASSTAPRRVLDVIRVKGRMQPVCVYEILRPTAAFAAADVASLVTAFEQGRNAYLARDWAQAERRFLDCLALKPTDRPSQIYLERLERLAEAPPHEGWDGVYAFSHK